MSEDQAGDECECCSVVCEKGKNAASETAPEQSHWLASARKEVWYARITRLRALRAVVWVGPGGLSLGVRIDDKKNKNNAWHILHIPYCVTLLAALSAAWNENNNQRRAQKWRVEMTCGKRRQMSK